MILISVFSSLVEADQMAAARASGGRKVRAPQGMVLDNVQRGQPQGKCHREKSASRSLGEGW